MIKVLRSQHQKQPERISTKPITVRALLEWCHSAIEDGHGERYVFMTADDEENSFHPAYCGFGLPCEEDMEHLDTPRRYDIDKIIILS